MAYDVSNGVNLLREEFLGKQSIKNKIKNLKTWLKKERRKCGKGMVIQLPKKLYSEKKWEVGEVKKINKQQDL